jgi:GTP-binding protein
MSIRLVGYNTTMLIDYVEVKFKSGDGGHGKTSFRKNMKGPDGGNGGDGGNVIVIAKNDLKLLNQFSRVTDFFAEKGVSGGTNRRMGRKGEDIIIYLPVGTSIIDKKSGREICDLINIDQKVILCKGGKGGLGNWEFRMDQPSHPAPSKPGQKGETKELILSLKIIADFGLIGLPNSGKSSLLNELTGSHAKTANYPFTTLSPSLGVFEGKVISDIPGLIEGASQGKGLGMGFLKHIEKVKVLLHCISCESTDILKDYKTVREELTKFNSKLLDKNEVILLTKSDITSDGHIKKLTQDLTSLDRRIFPVSINDWKSLETLKEQLR